LLHLFTGNCQSRDTMGNGLSTGVAKEHSHCSFQWLNSCASPTGPKHPTKTGVAMGACLTVVPPGREQMYEEKAKSLEPPAQTERGDNF